RDAAGPRVPGDRASIGRGSARPRAPSRPPRHEGVARLMAQLLYLDIDDEITSAAARIRSASDVRVALVLPAGSRLATSRINFRLLAREAQARHRNLSIVAAEGSARSLAASAGLAAYSTVGEFEDVVDAEEKTRGDGAAEAQKSADDDSSTRPSGPRDVGQTKGPRPAGEPGVDRDMAEADGGATAAAAAGAAGAAATERARSEWTGDYRDPGRSSLP